MKKIEMHTYQKAKHKGYNVRHGLICCGVIPCGGYKHLSAVARRKSKSIGLDIVDGFRYDEMADRERGLAAVCVITYEQSAVQVSETWDFFENGKYSYSIKDIWRKGGKYTSNRYIDEKKSR